MDDRVNSNNICVDTKWKGSLHKRISLFFQSVVNIRGQHGQDPLVTFIRYATFGLVQEYTWLYGCHRVCQHLVTHFNSTQYCSNIEPSLQPLNQHCHKIPRLYSVYYKSTLDMIVNRNRSGSVFPKSSNADCFFTAVLLFSGRHAPRDRRCRFSYSCWHKLWFQVCCDFVCFHQFRNYQIVFIVCCYSSAI